MTALTDWRETLDHAIWVEMNHTATLSAHPNMSPFRALLMRISIDLCATRMTLRSGEDLEALDELDFFVSEWTSANATIGQILDGKLRVPEHREAFYSIAVLTDLYRAYDADGVLLYIGISVNALNRLRQHRDRSGWFADYRTLTRETFPSREAALAAEEEAIRSEGPLWNVVHNSKNKENA